jgi:hypothetical protein
MVKRLLERLLYPVRVAAGRFVILPRPYIGPHGCISAAASFLAWNQVEGDYLEFGVYRGDALAAAYHALGDQRRLLDSCASREEDFLRWQANKPRFFAFDSFEGMPVGPAERHVDYFPGAMSASESAFRRNVADLGVDLSRVISVPGFYDQSLTPEVKKKHGLRKAAMVMIDCDLYESTVPVMEFLTDLVHQGTILIFHDWFRYKGSPNQGEQRACREWLARTPHIELVEYWREGPQAVAFLVNLK